MKISKKMIDELKQVESILKTTRESYIRYNNLSEKQQEKVLSDVKTDLSLLVAVLEKFTRVATKERDKFEDTEVDEIWKDLILILEDALNDKE